MKNPWSELPIHPSDDNFVLPHDLDLTLAHNKGIQDKAEEKKREIEAERNTTRQDKLREQETSLRLRFVHTNILPNPFIGNLDTARVVLLYLNPGFMDDDPDQYLGPVEHRIPGYFEENRKSLTFECDPTFPFYYLNPKFCRSNGYRYWHTHMALSALAESCGGGETGLSRMASRIMCIQFFPYHSKADPGMSRIVQSQFYSFSLVEQAMAQRKKIILMRSEISWLNHVPDLAFYDRLIRTNRLGQRGRHQFTKGNFPEGEWDNLQREIQS